MWLSSRVWGSSAGPCAALFTLALGSPVAAAMSTANNNNNTTTTTNNNSSSSPFPHPVALSPEEFRAFRLVSKHPETHDTCRFRFALPSEHHILGMQVASCLVVRATVDGKEVVRPYTPVTPPGTQGHFDLIIKHYDGGQMSHHIFQMEIGDTLDCKGPFPKLPYQPNMKKRIGMLAGGTGLTPMLQVLQEIASNPDDKTEVDFIFANRSPRDIILHEELAAMERKHPNIRVHYCVSKTGVEPWHGHVGHINRELVEKICPKPQDGEDILILVCGPPPFMKTISGPKNPDKSQGPLSGLLLSMGYTSDQVYKF